MNRDLSAVVVGTTASTLVPTDEAGTWRVLSQLVDELWCVDVLVAEERCLLIHSVASSVGDEPGCWLTWTLSPLPTGPTEVMVQHWEQAGAGPPPELPEVLAELLVRACAAVATR